MSTPGDDVFARLGLVIDDWGTQVAQSHEALSAQIGTARSHLDRLLGVLDGAGDLPPSHEGAATDLHAEITRLNAELDALREQSGIAGSGSLPAQRDSDAERHTAELEEALASALADLAVQTDAVRAQEAQLREAAETIHTLEVQLDSAAQSRSSEHGSEIAALQAAFEMLQLEYAEAQDEIRALKQELASGSGAAGGSGIIDAFDGRGHKKRMGEILVELGVLTEVQLKQILKEQAADPQRRFGAIVVERGHTGEDLVAKILAAQLRLPYQDLHDIDPHPEAVALVSPHVVKLHRCMPLIENDGVLTVAMVNPLDLIAIEDMELASKCRVTPVVSTQSQIDELIAAHYPGTA